jgi:hypothetical protein
MTSTLSSLVRFSSLEKSLLHASVSVLMAGDVSLWMGAGRDLVEQLWTKATLGAQLCGILSDLSWGGWKLLELSHVTKHFADLLDSDAFRGLVLLAALYRAQRLRSMSITWLQRLEERVLTRFENWAITPEKVRCIPVGCILLAKKILYRWKNFNPSSTSPAFSLGLFLLYAVLLTRCSMRLIQRNTIKLIPRMHPGYLEAV